MYTGVLIDPRTQSVTEVKLPGDEAFQTLLGEGVEYFECVTLRLPSPGDPGAALYLVEEGLERPDQRFWAFQNAPDKIYGGPGLVVAVDDDGDTCGGLASAEVIASHILWYPTPLIAQDSHAS